MNVSHCLLSSWPGFSSRPWQSISMDFSLADHTQLERRWVLPNLSQAHWKDTGNTKQHLALKPPPAINMVMDLSKDYYTHWRPLAETIHPYGFQSPISPSEQSAFSSVSVFNGQLSMTAYPTVSLCMLLSFIGMQLYSCRERILWVLSGASGASLQQSPNTWHRVSHLCEHAATEIFLLMFYCPG